MRKEFEATIANARRNLSHLQGKTISIDYFAKEILPVDTNSNFSNDVIALFNVNNHPKFGGQKTIVIDAEKGVYLSDK